MALSLTPLNRVRVVWSGFLGGPGVSTFYTDGGSVPNLAALKTFFTALSGMIPSVVTLTFPASGDRIDPASGSLTGSWATTPPAPLVGAGSGSYSAAAGLQVSWVTGEIADNHALRGRTFIVPAVSAVFGSDGQVLAAQSLTASNAGNALVASASPAWMVWHRPKKGPKPAGGGPAPITRSGSSATIISTKNTRLPVVLTTRRD
jgi:hypothetical protein